MREAEYLRVTAEDCLKNLKAVGIPYGKITGFSVNTRAKKRWGQTKCHMAAGTYEININVSLLDGKHDEGLRNTLYHEILHTCPGCMNHGDTWNKYGNIVKRKLGYEILRCDTAENKGFAAGEYEANVMPVKYAFRCTVCGQVVRRMKASAFTKHPEFYKCGCCGGKFIRIAA